MDTVVASDLDGTLFYPKKRIGMITRKNRRFLRRFLEDHGTFVVVTSRGERLMHRLHKAIGYSFDFICNNGSYIVHDGTPIRDIPLDPSSFKALVQDLRDSYHPKIFLLNTKDRVICTSTDTKGFTNIVYFLYELAQGKYREPVVRSDHVFYSEVEKGRAYKMMFLVGITPKKVAFAESLVPLLQKKYPQFEFAWVKQFIEVSPAGCSKAEGLGFYLENCGFRKDNVFVVGDSGNDVPMFDAFHKHSYCMAHSPDSVKARAAHVVRRVSDLEDVLYPSEDSKQTPKGKTK